MYIKVTTYVSVHTHKSDMVSKAINLGIIPVQFLSVRTRSKPDLQGQLNVPFSFVQTELGSGQVSFFSHSFMSEK